MLALRLALGLAMGLAMGLTLALATTTVIEFLYENENAMKQGTHKCRFFIQHVHSGLALAMSTVTENPGTKIAILCKQYTARPLAKNMPKPFCCFVSVS